MIFNRDRDLLAFLLGELPVLKRLDVRMRLLVSSSYRKRLAELETVSGAVAGAIGSGGALAFLANRRVKLRRLLVADLLVVGLLAAMIASGGVMAWRTLRPVPVVDYCSPASAAGPTNGNPMQPPVAGPMGSRTRRLAPIR